MTPQLNTPHLANADSHKHLHISTNYTQLTVKSNKERQRIEEKIETLSKDEAHNLLKSIQMRINFNRIEETVVDTLKQDEMQYHELQDHFEDQR